MAIVMVMVVVRAAVGEVSAGTAAWVPPALAPPLLWPSADGPAVLLSCGPPCPPPRLRPSPRLTWKPVWFIASWKRRRAFSNMAGSAPGCSASLYMTHAWLMLVSASSGGHPSMKALVFIRSSCSYLMAACSSCTLPIRSGTSATDWHALTAGSYSPALKSACSG
jgi:hypothetical protein